MPFPSNLKYTNYKDDFEDNIISSQPQDGKVITRKKYTKTRRKFTVDLPPLTASEASDLNDHYIDVEKVSSFLWNHPETINPATSSTSWTVRFTKPITIKKSAKFPDLFDVDSLELMEV